MKEPVFVDASAWVAITNRKNRNRREAVKIFQRLLRTSTALVTTNWTAYEALTIVKSRLGFSQAEQLWDRIKSRAVVELVAIDEQIERQALTLFWRYQDKTWVWLTAAVWSLWMLSVADMFLQTTRISPKLAANLNLQL